MRRTTLAVVGTHLTAAPDGRRRSLGAWGADAAHPPGLVRAALSPRIRLVRGGELDRDG